MDNEEMTAFPPETADKVERLLDVLEEMAGHPALRGGFAMYGGTAINLFMLGTPRLSVDIDATFVGSPDKSAMLAAKPEIENAIGEVARALGFSFEPGRAEHAGRSFYLGYRGPHGLDNIKIDFTYLNRVPLLPVEGRATPMREGLKVPMLSDCELVGGKAKAFFSRVKVRDLYDISNLATLLKGISEAGQRDLFHKVILFDAALSAAFPFGFPGRERRFAGKQRELESELYPMLRGSDARPELSDLMEAAAAFIAEWVLPNGDDEQEFLDLFAAGEYKPSLLFDGDMASRASQSPEAAWKLANLKKMAE